MNLLPVEARPICRWCEEDDADPIFGDYCSAWCQQAAADAKAREERRKARELDADHWRDERKDAKATREKP